MSAADNLSFVRSEIAKAARAAGREPDSVTLVAVSKTFEASDIRPVIDAGQRVFGENRVQEARTKWPALKAATPGIELHLIGPLQTNKVKDALDLFDVIQFARPAVAGGRTGQGIRQTGGAAAAAPMSRSIPATSRRRPACCRRTPTPSSPSAAADHGLAIAGLMCIPPFDENPAPHFALLAKIAARNGLDQLSMGMSADFDTAIAFGATHVRVGSAIFGHRA